MNQENEKMRYLPLPPWPGSGISAPVSTDPLGSYTGRPADPYEKPVQDADDF